MKDQRFLGRGSGIVSSIRFFNRHIERDFGDVHKIMMAGVGRVQLILGLPTLRVLLFEAH